MSKPNELRHDNLVIGVNFPVKSTNAGTGLVGGFPWPVHNAADYKDRVPAAWLSAMGPRHVIFFLGAPDPTRHFDEQGLAEHEVELDQNGCPRDREMWFDFQGMNTLDRHVAVVLGVQGLNALTGLPTSSEHKRGLYNGPGCPKPEQYPDVCPVHGTPFEDHRRMCSDCGFEWPYQNYVTNSVTDPMFRFWWDGWRGADGKIQQFAMRPASAGVGVAQQVLGEDRALGLSLAVFLKKRPKPAPVSSYRHSDFLESDIVSKGFLGGGGKKVYSFGMGGEEEEEVYRSPTLGTTREATRGDTTRGGVLGGRPSVSRIGAPSRMEFVAGRTVFQKLYSDNSTLDEWRDEPEVTFTLIPVDMAWAAEVTKYGPTTRQVATGPFAGLKSVG
ncbi:hypothetical protein HYV70_01780 [Candidatus Uhrbacteria bacterium]|nr:hypothetical protein [Candidatus Uhrbacteria bacterium]